MSKFDDFVLYEPDTDKIWIGRRDTKTQDQPWQWWIATTDDRMRPYELPKQFIIISREPEFSLCWGPL